MKKWDEIETSCECGRGQMDEGRDEDNEIKLEKEEINRGIEALGDASQASQQTHFQSPSFSWGRREGQQPHSIASAIGYQHVL